MISFFYDSQWSGWEFINPFRPGHPEVQRSGHLAKLRCYLNAISLIVNSTVNENAYKGVIKTCRFLKTLICTKGQISRKPWKYSTTFLHVSLPSSSYLKP